MRQTWEPGGDGGRLPPWGGVPFFSVDSMRGTLVAELLNLGKVSAREIERGFYELLESGRIFRLPIAEGFIGSGTGGALTLRSIAFTGTEQAC